MKFAKELEHELVPEWRAKYLDYKAGKKKVKAVKRAIREANRTPSHHSLRRPLPEQGGNSDTPAGSQRSVSFRGAEKRLEGVDTENNPAIPKSPALTTQSTPGHRLERQPLRVPGSRFSAVVGSYGSILASPPQQEGTSDVASLELPDPALDYQEDGRWSARHIDHRNTPKTPSPVMSRQASTRTVLRNFSHQTSSTDQPATGREAKKRTAASASGRRNSRLLKRVLSTAESPEKLAELNQRSEVERKQDEFFAFLDGELEKIESFYHMKEREASERLRIIREQLHTMRNQRVQEVRHVRRYRSRDIEQRSSEAPGRLSSSRIKVAFAGRRIGKNSEALAALATPGGAQPQDPDFITRRRDFTRHPEEDPLPRSEVPYRSAKRKLKYALQEFYRGVELLKSYAYVNRTAFRKINKKYDKVVGTRPSMRFISEKVNKAWFVQSEVTESLLATAEDLYARYFEGGKRKIAASKLRHTLRKSGDYSPNTFRCGLLSMAGVLFAIQSLIYAGQHLKDSDPTIRVHTGYLLQVRLRPDYIHTQIGAVNLGSYTGDIFSLFSISSFSV
ncbi:SPX-domain-containing protein [Aspergillus lucknowensis]|uniref:SPX-domain-containing protein n=1 Tax=Aspergillus lucknowensis TaxID=176173 RepID=A0ABR4L9W4_9EURO